MYFRYIVVFSGSYSKILKSFDLQANHFEKLLKKLRKIKHNSTSFGTS